MDIVPQASFAVKSLRPKRATVAGTAAIDKAFDVLDAIARAASPPNLRTLGEAIGLPRSTLHRLVSLLTARGLVGTDASGTCYVLGLHALELSRLAWERSDVRTAASAVLRALAREAGEAVHLASLIENQIVYVDKVDSDHSIRLHSAIGKRGPIHCTALGKVLTAFLPQAARADLLRSLPFPRFTPRTVASSRQMAQEWEVIRYARVAFDREEHALGVHCVAAPIFDYRGQPVAALSITAPTIRVDAAQLEQFAPIVLAAAQAITSTLGGAFPAPVAS